jgi:hypothetical protein
MRPDFSSALNDDSVSWIQNNLEPDDVFSAEQLETWAENNGYKLEV